MTVHELTLCRFAIHNLIDSKMDTLIWVGNPVEMEQEVQRIYPAYKKHMVEYVADRVWDHMASQGLIEEIVP